MNSVEAPAKNKKPRCQFISKIGARCPADPQTGKAYCFFHDPDQKKKQAEARRQGGEARTRQAEPEITLPSNLPAISLQNASDVCELLSQTVNHLRCGEMDLRAANAIAYLSSILLRALKANCRQAIEPLVDTINRFRAGRLDLPTAKGIGHLVSLMLSAIKQATLEEQAAADKAIRRDVSGRIEPVPTPIVPAKPPDGHKMPPAAIGMTIVQSAPILSS